MRTIITAEQDAFYTKNGFIEFEMAHEDFDISLERDLWRENESLKTLIFKKLGPIALHLSGKKQIRLGASQWFTKENRPQKNSPLKDHLCIQNLRMCAVIGKNIHSPKKRSPLGILPQPESEKNILFFETDLILDWENVSADLLFIIFTLPKAVYSSNQNDPNYLYLKKLGYGYGDLLLNKTHPLFQ